MKIGVVSDSHSNKKSLSKAIKAMGKVDLIFHLGDYFEDGIYLRTLTSSPVHIVKGNMDFFSEGGHDEILTTFGGVQIFACHGHLYDVKQNLQHLYFKGKAENARIVLFGHTHIPYLDDDGEMMMMNPGTVGAARMSGYESYGLITINKGQIKGEIIPLERQVTEGERE